MLQAVWFALASICIARTSSFALTKPGAKVCLKVAVSRCFSVHMSLNFKSANLKAILSMQLVKPALRTSRKDEALRVSRHRLHSRARHGRANLLLCTFEPIRSELRCQRGLNLIALSAAPGKATPSTMTAFVLGQPLKR